jgi:hypothetical protein
MLALHHHRMGKMATMRLIVDGQDMGARKVYPVDREHPMYQAYFDEWQHQIGDHKVDPVAKAILKATEDVVTQTRKTMQGLVLAGQATGLVASASGTTTIRTQCQAGGMVAHRNNNESGPAGVRQRPHGRPVHDPDGPVWGGVPRVRHRPAGLDGPQRLGRAPGPVRP